jgi:hypothetical protein
MMVEEKYGIHWYIIGEWSFLIKMAKLSVSKKYDKGILISEEEIKPNPL